MRDKKEMSPEDLERVEHVLNKPLYRVERKPFSFWKMALFWVLMLTVFSVFSVFIARYYGVL